jgi:protein-S-isoprenylcysteine O-methyltransferase Ste14
MICKKCGTEIADKALICYRCGTATFEAKRQPAAIGGARNGMRGVIVVVGLVVLILAALFLGQAQNNTVPEWVRWTIIGLALLVLAWRMFTRVRRSGRNGRLR